MEAPVVQQLEKEVNALKQRLREYNKEQLSLRVATKAIDEKKQELLGKVRILSCVAFFPFRLIRTVLVLFPQYVFILMFCVIDAKQGFTNICFVCRLVFTCQL
jgi:uncharacterized membrane protein (DUF106 family)